MDQEIHFHNVPSDLINSHKTDIENLIVKKQNFTQ